MQQNLIERKFQYVVTIMLAAVLLNASCKKEDDSDSESEEGGPCGSGSSQVSIPNVAISCTTATDCTDNTADDNVNEALEIEKGHAHIYWILVGGKTPGGTSSCNQTVKQTTAGDIMATQKSTLSCMGGTCTLPKAISEWVDAITGDEVTKLCTGGYVICTQIDSDGFGVGETGEPYLELELKLTEDTDNLTLEGGKDIQ